jgi:magnesium chelatase family protein
MSASRCGHILTYTLYGIEGMPVDIEVAILPGLPSFEIVGLGDSAVRESRNRVHAAIRNSGFCFPASRITASYAPAWLRKEGSAFDLPLALAILMASGQIDAGSLPLGAWGELSLTGRVRGVPGSICRAAACQGSPVRWLLVPSANAAETRLALKERTVPVDSLQEAAARIADLACGRPAAPAGMSRRVSPAGCGADSAGNGLGAAITAEPAGSAALPGIFGQRQAVRTLLIAAAGWHNLLLLGSPGCGKSVLASAMPAVLPPLDDAEAMLVTRILSASGHLAALSGLVRCRPFRAPHHTISRSALIGGGAIPAPGEISLAHLGVLFLDEMTEIAPELLDSLRQPLEEHCVKLDPADFILVGAANPCQCGEYLEPSSACRCSALSVRQHMSRLSGPLIDRIDLVAEMTRLTENDLQRSVRSGQDEEADLSGLARKVSACWERQAERCARHGMAFCFNGRQSHVQLAEKLELDGQSVTLAAAAATRLRLTARSYHKLLRVSRTIADLEGSDLTKPGHVAEAMQYRLHRPEE